MTLGWGTAKAQETIACVYCVGLCSLMGDAGLGNGEGPGDIACVDSVGLCDCLRRSEYPELRGGTVQDDQLADVRRCDLRTTKDQETSPAFTAWVCAAVCTTTVTALEALLPVSLSSVTESTVAP